MTVFQIKHLTSELSNKKRFKKKYLKAVENHNNVGIIMNLYVFFGLTSVIR